jgi:hypothetical protein
MAVLFGVPVVLCRGLEKSLSARHGRSTAGARHGHGVVCVNQTRPHCLNQMGKTHRKPLAAWHGWETAWARHGMCELAFIVFSSLVVLTPNGNF